MGFEIPNVQSDPAFDGQSVADESDWKSLVLGLGQSGVIYGCNVKQDSGTDMNVIVEPGWIQFASDLVNIPADTTLSIATASATDRKDIVVWTYGSTGLTVIEGTPCSVAGWTRSSGALPPVKPPLPQSTIELAEVYVPANTLQITDSMIVLKAPNIAGRPIINVVSAGADPTGMVDSTFAIDLCLALLPERGGVVYFPAGTYLLSSTLQIGNGTSTSLSTTSGIRLVGEGVTGSTLYDLDYEMPGAVLKWNSSSAAPIVSVNGPLKGWSIENLTLDGNGGSASAGLKVVSGSSGVCRNIAIKGCLTGLLSETVPNFGAYSCNAWRNQFENFTVQVPDMDGAIGIKLDGDTSSPSADTCYALFMNTSIMFENTTSQVTNYGLYLKFCDNNRFIHLTFVNSVRSPGGTSYCLVFDYTGPGGGYLPADNTIDGVDFRSNRALIANVGSPTGTPENRVVCIAKTNGRPPAPSLTGLLWGYTASNP